MDLFEAVILNDFDVVVLLETSLVVQFHDENHTADQYSVFICGVSSSIKFS
jgi:hypothetical protein